MSEHDGAPPPIQIGRWLATAGLVVVAMLASTSWLDEQADGHFEAAFQRALVTFALARALNGVISVIQGTEVAVEPAGVGVTFAPGEIVDPVNDLIERFSWIMLASTTSLGVQNILMEMSAWTGTRIITAGAAILALALLWRGGSVRARRWALRLALLAAFLRLAMPLVMVLNHGAYELFLATSYERSTAAVEETREQLAELERPPTREEPQGWLERARDWLGARTDALDVRERIDRIEAQLSSATEHLLRLTALFIVQTILLPLLFLWALARAVRGLGGFR